MPPVRPRDAASLILLRGDGARTQVLMGRRRSKAAFLPDAYVFPGGRLDPHDAAPAPARALNPDVVANMTRARAASPARAAALANAAIRETFEETGLLLARPGAPLSDAAGTWADFAARGVAPDHAALSYLGRAITPPESPIRFHARFFIARLDGDGGALGGSGELIDLQWLPPEEALRLPIIDVTEFMLRETLRILETPDARTPLFSYRRNRPFVRYL